MSQAILKREQIPTDKKIFLVHGNSARNLDIGKYILSLDTVSFSDFEPNPQKSSINKGVEQFLESQADIIVAIGGGSAIDVAKSIKAFSQRNVTLIAVPTTAGSGSESTRTAVYYENREKSGIFGDDLLPDAIILEPEVLLTLPEYQKKCTLLDALSQAIESFWSVNSNETSRQFSIKAIELILNNVQGYLKNQNLTEILYGSNLAGRAINITGTTAGHAMSYKFTSEYKIPHGAAVAICNNALWNYIQNNEIICTDPRGREYIEDIFRVLTPTMDIFQQLLKDWNITFDKRLMDSEILFFAAQVNPDQLKNFPIKLDFDTLKNLYREISK